MWSTAHCSKDEIVLKLEQLDFKLKDSWHRLELGE